VSVSPADFELYSRSTGAPLPRTPGERMRMAPEVHNFVRSQGYAQKPDLWRGTIRPLLQNAAIGYGIASAAKSFADNASVSTPGTAPVREPVDVSWSQVGETPPALPSSVANSGNTASPQNPRPQLPPTGGTMGTIGSMTRDLNTSPTYGGGQAVPTSVVDVQGTGFDAPVYGRNLAPHLDNMKSVWIPNADKTEPFTFAVGTVGSLLGAGIQNAPTIATQGYYDLQKGYRDLKLGEEHTKAAISGVKNWHDNKLVPWHNQTLVPNVRGALGLEQVQPGSVFGVPIDNSSFNVSPLERHPDVLPGERSHNRNHNIHRDVNRYPNDEPGPWVPDVESNISAANVSTRANALSGLGREGVPVGAIPSLRMGDIRTTDESASLSPQGDLIATNLQGVPDPVNAVWYGGQRPTQNVLDEATANLRRKYADVYESQGITGDTLPDDERISGWQGQGGGSEGLAGTASGVINYEPAPGYGQQRSVQPVVSPVPQRSLEQEAREHFSDLGAISFAPKESTSVSRFAMGPGMMVDTLFKNYPERRYTKDLATSDYVVEPSVIPEINPATLAAIEQDVRDEAVESGLSVLQEMADVERTGRKAGDLANRITRSREFKNKPGYYTYRTEADPWL